MTPIALEVDDTHHGLFRVGERQDRKGTIGEAVLLPILDDTHTAQYAAEPLFRLTALTNF